MSPTVTHIPPWERSSGSNEAASGTTWSPTVEDNGLDSLLRPNMQRNTSNGSSSGEGRPLSPGASQRVHLKRLSVMERTLIQVTEDNERFSVVDISGLNSAAAIKERMMSKLREWRWSAQDGRITDVHCPDLFEDDPTCFALSRTEIGMSGQGGARMNDDELLALCWQSGDDKGSLKFLLQQVAPPSHNSMLPPPPSTNLSPQLVPRELLHDNTTNTTNTSTPTSYSRPPHSKSGSLSSRSSVGEMLGHGDSTAAGDSGSEASARLAGGLYRVKATSRRTGGTGSSISSEDTRSPITSARSPPPPSTPLLAAVAEQESRDSVGPSTSVSKPVPSRPMQPERSESRKDQSPSGSPIEEIRDLEDPAAASGRTASGLRRNSNTRRPSSSHTPYRTSLHGQWESEVGTSSSRSSIAVVSSPRTLQSSLADRPASARGDERPSSALPKSLTPGGKDPRGMDAADAAHMYLGRSSSPANEAVYSPYSAGPGGGGQSQQQQQQQHHQHHQQQQQQHQALGIHNVRSVDDFGRRSRPSMPSVSEASPVRREQQGYVLPRMQAHPPAPPAAAITRQGSADAHLGHRPPPSFGQPPAHQFTHDYRYGPAPVFGGTLGKPDNSVGFERERSTSFGSAGLPLRQQVSMVPRPAGPGFEVLRTNPNARPGMMASPPSARPMTPSSLHPYDGRYAPSPQPGPRPVVYTNDFGVRTHVQGQPGMQHHPSDPRLMSPPFSTRPHTFHDQQRRPIILPPGHGRPHISQHQAPPREDPFISANFPASSSVMVSEFQRHPNNSLQPGMTVQETMQQRHAYMLRNAEHRDMRNMVSRAQNRSYEHQVHAVLPSQRPGPPPPSQPSMAQQPQQYHQGQQQQQASSALAANYQPPLRRGPPQPRTSNAASQSQTLTHQRPHTAAVDGSGPPTERSSGSSFTTVSSLADSSHRRNISSEDRGNAGWLEESYSAPTSARSSRSESVGQESKGQATRNTDSDFASDLPYSNGTTVVRKDSLEEADLINLRPLPKVPSQELHGKQDSEETKNEDEDTLRATEWKKMLSSLEADADHTAEPMTVGKVSSAELLSPKRSETNKSESSSTSHNTVVPNQPGAREADDEERGAFASFDDDDDENDEGGTWAQPLDRLPIKKEPISPSTGEATLRPGGLLAQAPYADASVLPSPQLLATSPRRPVLTLNIDPNVHASPLLTNNVSPKSVPADARPEALLQPPSSKDSPRASPASSGINRRTSFARRDVDWAFRPPPEQLYDNLDDFFPKHDLDKPVLDNLSGLPTSPQTASPRTEPGSQQPMPTSPAPLSSARSRFQHKKSIRIVAQDRKRFLERAEAAERRRAEGEGLSRRRSTKLWGQVVVEVTPGVDGSASSSLGSAESPLPDASAKPVFKWVKGDLIGKGTYGRVYLALNATTGEMIAVKQVELPTTDSDREDARQKGVVSALKSEIETLKDLDHPNIVSYLGFEETTSYLSIFLEYVPGGSVGSCLRKHGKLDEATIKSFLQQILVGLNYLHNRGILHRDLKADNLLVDFNGVVKISDFGTVRKSEDIYGNIASMSIQGSIFWMAPEVVSLSRAGYSAKVDIWSLGCVVLEMFAGRRPWSDEEAVQAMFKIGAERRAPPIPPDVRLSRAAAHFLKTCFAVDPASRPTAQRLLEHVFPHVLPGWHFADSSLYRALHR